MSSLMACIAGMALDAIFGDPVWLYHPVRIIGNWISILEKWLRGFCKNDEKKERIAGCVLWFGVVIASVGIPWGLLYLVGKVSFWLQFALETFWCYQLLAGKCLKDESRKVYVRLVNHNLEGARHAVSMIVGRDTGNLSEAGVTKAAVETVAENTSDGVIAPLIFMLIGGAAVFSGLFMVYAALCFFTLDGLEFMNVLTDGAREYGKYPIGIYGKRMLQFCTVIVPYALIQYYPLLYLLGRTTSLWNMVMPLFAVIFLIPCYVLWRIGVRHYKSSGS